MSRSVSLFQWKLHQALNNAVHFKALQWAYNNSRKCHIHIAGNSHSFFTRTYSESIQLLECHCPAELQLQPQLNTLEYLIKVLGVQETYRQVC